MDAITASRPGLEVGAKNVVFYEIHNFNSIHKCKDFTVHQRQPLLSLQHLHISCALGVPGAEAVHVASKCLYTGHFSINFIVWLAMLFIPETRPRLCLSYVLGNQGIFFPKEGK